MSNALVVKTTDGLAAVVLGSAIHMTRWRPEATRLLARHAESVPCAGSRFAANLRCRPARRLAVGLARCQLRGYGRVVGVDHPDRTWVDRS